MPVSAGWETMAYSRRINPRMFPSNATAVMGMSSFFAFFRIVIYAGIMTSSPRRARVEVIEIMEEIKHKGLLISAAIHNPKKAATHAAVAIAEKTTQSLKNLYDLIHYKNLVNN